MLRDQDFEGFVVAMMGVASVLGHTLDERQLQIYWHVLKGKFASMAEFQESWQTLLSEWKYSYMPKPAHFIEKSEVNSDELELIAMRAWETVREALRDGVGYTTNGEFEDALIPTVVELCGGFFRLAHKTHSELEWVKKEFMKTYIGAVRSKMPVTTNIIVCDMDFSKQVEFRATYKIPNLGKNLNVNLLPQPKKQHIMIANLADSVRVNDEYEDVV